MGPGEGVLPEPSGLVDLAVAPGPEQESEGGEGAPGVFSAVTLTVRSLDLEALRAAPVASLAAPEAVLLLWAQPAFHFEAFELARSWGFGGFETLTWLRQKTQRAGVMTGVVEH